MLYKHIKTIQLSSLTSARSASLNSLVIYIFRFNTAQALRQLYLTPFLAYLAISRFISIANSTLATTKLLIDNKSYYYLSSRGCQLLSATPIPLSILIMYLYKLRKKKSFAKKYCFTQLILANNNSCQLFAISFKLQRLIAQFFKAICLLIIRLLSLTLGIRNCKSFTIFIVQLLAAILATLRYTTCYATRTFSFDSRIIRRRL